MSRMRRSRAPGATRRAGAARREAALRALGAAPRAREPRELARAATRARRRRGAAWPGARRVRRRSAAASSSHVGQRAARRRCARPARRHRRPTLLETLDQLGEVFAPVLEVPILVEAGAGRAEQHHVAGHGGRGGVRDGRREIGQHDAGRRPLPHGGAPALEGLAQRTGRGADEDGLLDAPLGGGRERVERRRP